MKVLITGATGLVGKEVTRLCREQGITVHYLTTSQKKISSEPDYKGFYWNPSTDELDVTSLEGVDAIIHLAGASIAQKWTPENKQLIKDSRIKSAQMLYDALFRFRESGNTPSVKHIISASAIGGYPSSSTKLYNEKYPTYASGFLGEVVQEWEETIVEFQKLDIATSLVRTGVILDKNQGALPKIVQPIRFFAGAPLGSGQQWQSWIHIEDMARIYMQLLNKELTGIYNGVAPNPVTNEKLTKVIAKTIKKPLFLPNIPEKVLKLMLGEMAAIVLESQLVSAEKIMETGFVFTYPTVEQAIENLL
ncbi:TIGR01777 family oxidoreductase [uncultured Dokdonia sp.]|uniref:TIGR01777 family oxidoreductase n=1 Tax=uncultured Dokdonia sp. TaxID=575653 RepID=UPI0026278E81|nr:TIGR01777 family oxidoreductase [uncultured Dokdonia sp.]